MNNKKNTNNPQVEFASIAGMLASRLSLNPTVGQIYGLLYMSPDPVSLNEMVEKLGISKGSASTNVRVLESWGAVRKVWVDNSRRDYYEANTDTLNLILKQLKEGLKKRFNEVTQRIVVAEEKINSDIHKINEKEIEFYRQQMKEVKNMYLKILDFLEILPGKEE
jgi:DNA-binding transcriptional regulator GbsR (MarR family)